jgi:hypothetical protein
MVVAVGDHGRRHGGCEAASTSTIATNCTLRQGMPERTTTTFVSREVSPRFAWSTIARSTDDKYLPVHNQHWKRKSNRLLNRSPNRPHTYFWTTPSSHPGPFARTLMDA